MIGEGNKEELLLLLSCLLSVLLFVAGLVVLLLSLCPVAKDIYCAS